MRSRLAPYRALLAPFQVSQVATHSAMPSSQPSCLQQSWMVAVAIWQLLASCCCPTHKPRVDQRRKPASKVGLSQSDVWLRTSPRRIQLGRVRSSPNTRNGAASTIWPADRAKDPRVPLFQLDHNICPGSAVCISDASGTIAKAASEQEEDRVAFWKKVDAIEKRYSVVVVYDATLPPEVLPLPAAATTSVDPHG